MTRTACALAALAALAAPSPAHATVTALRWSYTGDCSAEKTHNARPEDVVTLVVGEPLELEVLGTGFPTARPGLGSQAHVEAPPGIMATVKTSSGKGLTVSLLARTAGPDRGSLPIRIAISLHPPVEIAVRAVMRPRIQSIRLTIPGTEGLASVRLASGFVYAVKVTGTGLADLSFVDLSSSMDLGISARDGGFKLLVHSPRAGGFNLLAPANFHWALDSCPVGGPNDAALSVEVPQGPGRTRGPFVSGSVVSLSAPHPVSCGSEVRMALDDSYCASLPPPAPRSEAAVSGPPIRWTVRGADDVLVGSFEARLLDQNLNLRDTRHVPYLRLGESVSFETPRPGAPRLVQRDQACAGCFDARGPDSKQDDRTYHVDF